MNLISFMVQHYFFIKYQDFTEKLIAALALLEVCQGVTESDRMRVMWIEENTHSDVMVSMYELDRDINPSKGDFKQIHMRNRYHRNDWEARRNTDKNEYVELTAGRQQYYLCVAMKEIDMIVSRNLKGYAEEIKIPEATEPDDERYEIKV